MSEKQPFENYPKLAACIEDFAWKMQGISLTKWNRFLADLNDALHANVGEPVTREEMILAMCREQWRIKYPLMLTSGYDDVVNALPGSMWAQRQEEAAHFRRKAEISADAIIAKFAGRRIGHE